MSNMNTDDGFRYRILAGSSAEVFALLFSAKLKGYLAPNSMLMLKDMTRKSTRPSNHHYLRFEVTLVLCGHLLTSSISQIFGKLVLSR